MRGAERGAIPQQGIVFKVANGIRQVGDVGGVGCHIIVSSFELRAVNRVGAASRQVTVFDVGDFAGGFGAVRGAERGAIPQQGIVFKVANGIRQGIDTVSVGGDIGSAVVPPDPMPNSEVKRRSADGSVGSPHARVGNCQASNRPGRALCMRQDEPWKREGRHRVADPEEKGRREQRRERAISTFAHSAASAAASCAFAAARYSSLPESRAKSA